MGVPGPARSHRLRQEARHPHRQGKEQEAPFSIDANLLHTSSEGLVLEDPDTEVPDIVAKRADRRTITPEEAPDSCGDRSLSNSSAAILLASTASR